MTTPRVPSHIESLKPYQAGKSIAEIREMLGLERVIKLASNENPLGPSPKAIERMQKAVGEVNIYSRSGLELRQEIAKRNGLKTENVIASSGSEGVMLTAMRSYLMPGDEVITAEGTFIGFYVIASAMNLNMKTVPLTADYSYDLDAIAAAVTPETKLVYIANPNNPTGTVVEREAFDRFMEELPDSILVIMDEAYNEYAVDMNEHYPSTVDYRHPQILTLRTFSKTYGLASARVGYGVGTEEMIAPLLKVRLPFDLSWPSEVAGIGALEDDEFLQKTLSVNREGLKRLHDAVEELGLTHTNSYANFTLVPMESPERAEWLSQQLLENGIIARPMVAFRLPHTVRITIGSRDEITYLIEVLRKIFG